MDKNKDEKPAEGGTSGQSDEDINSLEQLSEGADKTAADQAAAETAAAEKAPKAKKSGIKKLFGFFNIYLLSFILLLIVGGAVFGVFYLNSKKTPKAPEIAVEDLSEESLNSIASQGEASIGSSDLLLNIQSNAVFNGQILAKGDVNIAGELRLGKQLAVPNLTVSGSSNLGTAQVNQLQVANSMTVQGALTVQQGLNVGGASTLGAVTASKVTTSSLTLSGTGALELNNHIIVNGPNPSRSTGGAVGSGGSASVSGSDTAGKVNINTGQGTAPGCFITINFTQRFNSVPNVIISPLTGSAGITDYYASATTTNFSVCTATAAPTGSTLDFSYLIIE